MSRATAMTDRSAARMSQAMRLIAGLLLSLVVVILLAQVTGRSLAPERVEGALLQERVIYITGDVDGAAEIRDENQNVLFQYAPGEGGFVSTIDLALRRKRSLARVDLDGPLHLRLRDGGVLALYDPSLDAEIRLRSFGPDSVTAFAGVLPAE